VSRRFGLLNALSQTLCKLTAPGVPDIYQGNEIWDFSLVDPDNRRAVDYRRRRALLAELQHADPGTAPRALAQRMEDGRAKLLLTWKALQLRRAHPQLFRDGDYRRLRVRGVRAQHVCAFARRLRQQSLVVIAPRLYRRLLGDEGGLPSGRRYGARPSSSCRARSARARSFRNVLDGAQLLPVRQGESVGVLAAHALADFPVALLTGGWDEPGAGPCGSTPHAAAG